MSTGSQLIDDLLAGLKRADIFGTDGAGEWSVTEDIGGGKIVSAYKVTHKLTKSQTNPKPLGIRETVVNGEIVKWEEKEGEDWKEKPVPEDDPKEPAKPKGGGGGK